MAKVLFTYNLFRESFAELEEKYEVTFPDGATFSREEIMEMIPEYDVLCTLFGVSVDRELIEKGTRLKLIANFGVGYNNIDVAAARERGITVANTPNAVTAPTANLALGLMIDAARRISECDRKLRREGKDMKRGILENLGTNVSGKTLGIIGMGRIGKALCKRAKACDMEVIYHNRHRIDKEEEDLLGVRYAALEGLLEVADFVSLNAPYTPETHHLIGEKELHQMKPSAILINTARGALMDEKALIKALQSGTIRGAGLDVFEFDDFPSDELLELENVVLTPHIGTQTMHDRLEMAKAVMNNVIGFLEGDRPVSKV